MSVTHSNTESESIIKDDQKHHKHVSSAKRKRYRSRNPQSLQKFKEAIARKKAARKRNKKFNQSFSSQIFYIKNQSKSTSYDQIKTLSNQKKVKETKKETETENQTHSYSETQEAAKNTHDTGSLLSFTPSELNLSDVFLSVLESNIHSDSNSTLFETKSNSNSYDTIASMEENEEEQEVNDDENPADESSCCQCLWIISIIGTIFLLAILGPKVYYKMAKEEVKEIKKDVKMSANIFLHKKGNLEVKDDWKINIDQLFTDFENKETYKNIFEFDKLRDVCFDKKKELENDDQKEYLTRKRTELYKSKKAIPKFIDLKKAEFIDEESKTHSFNGTYELHTFDRNTKKPVYISGDIKNETFLTYYKGLWSIIKLTPDLENECEVLVRWTLSGNVVYPGQLDSTKHPAEIILPNNDSIYSAAQDDSKKSINPELHISY